MADPPGVVTVTSLPKFTTQWQRFDELSPAALYELLRFRQQIFIVEQRSPYPDLDGLDQPAWHLWLRANGALAGCLRLLPPNRAAAKVKIGRVAVAIDLRRRGLGRRLLAEALSFCDKCYPGQPIVLSAQLSLENFYQSLGFYATAAPHDDFGVAHVEMAMPAGADRAC
jgi:ElaA protein